jgi:hypothetical protein
MNEYDWDLELMKTKIKLEYDLHLLHGKAIKVHWWEWRRLKLPLFITLDAIFFLFISWLISYVIFKIVEPDIRFLISICLCIPLVFSLEWITDWCEGR